MDMCVAPPADFFNALCVPNSWTNQAIDALVIETGALDWLRACPEPHELRVL